MSYRFQTDESVRAGVRRCAAERLDRAIGELSEHLADDPVSAVHAARKAVKQERALLRLARGALPRRVRHHENGVLRRAARELSAARDAEAMIATVDDLAERFTGQLPESDFSRIREALEQARDRRRPEAGLDERAARAISELGGVRVRVDEWTLDRDGFAALEPGIGRTYADGRRAFRRTRRRAGDEDWHTWRKRVKDLWYQQRLLAGVAGPVVTGQAKDTHRLADLLGDDHDLAVLRAALVDGRVTAAVALETLIALIDHRRRELQTEASRLGRRVYAEPTKAYVRRMRRSWRAERDRWPRLPGAPLVDVRSRS